MSNELIKSEGVHFYSIGRDKSTYITLDYYVCPDIGDIWVMADPNRFLQKEERDALAESLKAFKDRKYFGFLKDGEDIHGFGQRWCWGFPLTTRNKFLLDHHLDINPYLNWEKPLEEVEPNRPQLYQHQKDMFRHIITRRYVILGAEMGTGKSLAAIEALEYFQREENLKSSEVWYVAPVSGVRAIKLELVKWNSTIRPTNIMTYEGCRKRLKEWRSGEPAPKVVIFDESSKLKNMKAQRTKAAAKLAEAVRLEHGKKGAIVLMTGTPAPKTPVDWWAQGEVAAPGFIAESSEDSFRARLSVTETRDSLAGGSYTHVVTFLDDEKKCRGCGHPEDHMNHEIEYEGEVLARIPEQWPPKLKYGEEPPKLRKHVFEESFNEVAHLFKRMEGLVMVKFKKDCLDLPDKQYRIIRIKPNAATLQAAKMIKKTAKSAAVALIHLRELSDGFNYVQVENGTEECPICNGKGTVLGLEKESDSEINTLAPLNQMQGYVEGEVKCDCCDGSGEVIKYKRGTNTIDCPKDDIIRELLDENDELGRMVIWAAFSGTIEKLTEFCNSLGWSVLRIEGSGWRLSHPGGEVDSEIDEALMAMDASHPRKKELADKFEKLVVVGNPQAGGMGLTLTAAQMAVYYSNPFNGEARIQSEDRIHRAGIDKNTSPTIVDLIHLPSDRVVLENLKKKRRLQDLTLGELVSQIDKAETEIELHSS